MARGRGGLVKAHDESLLIGLLVASPSIATLANIRHSFERAVPKLFLQRPPHNTLWVVRVDAEGRLRTRRCKPPTPN
jgi:hypothetical protein